MMDSGLDSPMLEDEDMAVPCKGCSQVLEEGKAFELAGNRWHIDCFRCNSCGILLDSDANLLLLGDGSLICNNCTYSCTACGNKIEDLAILTGDQAFCAGCFRCRNCKRKIENLKYAKTNTGIFCMTCHETVMSRRKKRTRPPPQRTPTMQSSSSSNMASPMLSLDKSLPSLPVDDDMHSGSHSTTPTEYSARPRIDRTQTSQSNPDQLSPLVYQSDRTPRSHKRHSQASQASEASLDIPNSHGGAQDYSFIPLVLDNSTGPAPQLSSSSYRPTDDYNPRASVQYRAPDRPAPRPFDRKQQPAPSYYDLEKERGARVPVPSQDRIAELQDRDDNKSRDSQESERTQRERPTINTTQSQPQVPTQQTSAQNSAMGAQTKFSPANGSSQLKVSGKPGPFKLGEVPADKKKSLGTPKSADSEPSSATKSPNSALSEKPTNTFNAGSLPRTDSFRSVPTRADSPASVTKKPLESPVNSTSSNSGRSHHSHATSNSSAITTDSPETLQHKDSADNKPIQLSSTKTTVTNITYNDSSPSSKTTVTNITEREPTASQSYGSTRPSQPHRPGTSQDTTSSSNFSPVGNDFARSERSEHSPSVPALRSPVGGLVFDEELRRVFGGEPVLRRVSNSVRHGRSLSEAASSPKWPQAGNGAGLYGDVAAASPITSDINADNQALRGELRRSTQKIAQLEAKLNNSVSAKALESNIQEKRNTVALLETERETFLRELMVIKEQLDASKDGHSINIEEVKSDIIRGLARELESLKETLKAEIQALIAERDRLMEDVEGFGRQRDEAIREAETLNMKNQQLADLNNELTRQIQSQFETYKNRVPGLGIFDGSSSATLLEVQSERRPTASINSGNASSMGTPVNEQPIDNPEVFVAQKVATYKNGSAQQKKFFWKKPQMAKGTAGKVFNSLFASENSREGFPVDPQNHSELSVQQAQKHQPSDNPGKIFGTQKKWGKSKPTNGTAGAPDINPAAIFGGELDVRVEIEGVRIPSVVQKCIQEVEMRGMDLEGIYRKSGGATQMRQIQDQFERGEDVQFDPELDICSVTSVLKQYFRNLPNPLITYEVYDRFIDSALVQPETDRIRALKDVVDDLPSSHRHVLQFIIFHLARVASRNSENLMNTRNLSVVFAPTLMRHMSDEREMSDMHSKNNALQFLIDHHEEILQ